MRYDTMSTDHEGPMIDTEERLRLAEQVCLMVGWSASDNTDRGKARHELWAEWMAAYRAAGGSMDPRDHPELSDQRIRELAAQRDATVARTLALIRDDDMALEGVTTP